MENLPFAHGLIHDEPLPYTSNLFVSDVDRNRLQEAIEMIKLVGKSRLIYPKEELRLDISIRDQFERREHIGGHQPHINSSFKGNGGSKTLFKINEERVVFLPVTGEHSERWKVINYKEKEAYDILNKVGLISQQDPKMVQVSFNDYVYENTLSVLSFDYLAGDGQTMIWDHKNSSATGIVSLFGADPKETFDDLDYNLRLLSPLVKDLALWSLIGAPGSLTDSLNLIFHQQAGESQPQARLFIYDIYQHCSEASNAFGTYHQLDHKEGLPLLDGLRAVQEMDARLLDAASKVEELSRGSKSDFYLTRMKGRWEKLYPHLKEIYINEIVRLARL